MSHGYKLTVRDNDHSFIGYKVLLRGSRKKCREHLEALYAAASKDVCVMSKLADTLKIDVLPGTPIMAGTWALRGYYEIQKSCPIKS